MYNVYPRIFSLSATGIPSITSDGFLLESCRYADNTTLLKNIELCATLLSYCS